MKKLFLVVSIFALCLACRKNRTCNCTVVVDGTSTVRTQTAGIPFILPETDSTIIQPLYTVNEKKTNFNKVTKRDMRRVCQEKSEEGLNNSTTNVVPSIYTITTTNSGKKTTTCKIE